MFSLKSVILSVGLSFTQEGDITITAPSLLADHHHSGDTGHNLALGPGSDHQLMAPLSLVSDTLLTPALSGLSPSSSDSRQYEEDSGQRGPTVCVWSLSVRLQ